MTNIWEQPERNRAFARYEHLASEGGLNLRKFGKKLVALSALLLQDEVVTAFSAGTPEGDFRERLLAATDHRLLLIKDDPWDSTSVDLSRIAEVKWRRGIALGRLDVQMVDGKIKINSVDQGSGGLFAIRLQEARDASIRSVSKPPSRLDQPQAATYEFIDVYPAIEDESSLEHRRRELMEKKRELLLEEELEDEIEELEERRRERRLRRGRGIRRLPPGER